MTYDPEAYLEALQLALRSAYIHVREIEDNTDLFSRAMPHLGTLIKRLEDAASEAGVTRKVMIEERGGIDRAQQLAMEG